MSAFKIKHWLSAAFVTVALAGVAHAQQPEPSDPTTGPAAASPPSGIDQPSDDAPPAGHTGETGGHVAQGAAPAHGGEAHGAPAHGGGHHYDPSQFFNFFGFDYSGKDMMNGPLGDGKMVDSHGVTYPEEESKSPPFVLMVLNFAVLLGLLAWKGGPAIQKLAAERHDEIKTALEEAAKLREQAANKLAEYETRLKDADAEIKQLVDGMRADAEADKKRILESAQRQADQMKRDAELRIAAEIEAARGALTREVTAAASAATERILREKMTAADQQKLVGSFISDIQGAAQKEAH